MSDTQNETPDAHMVETLRLRTAAMHRVARDNDRLRQECLDREATERDVRARLADAEKALARVRVEAWDEGAKWAAVECGAIAHESVPWLTPSDNPHRPKP